MAVLETIRKKSVLLFIIIIGALLAFILGDFINSGRSFFGPGNTMASLGNVKVTGDQVNEQYDLLHARDKSGDNSQQRAFALQVALYRELMKNEFDRLGIDVPDEVFTKMISTPGASQYVMQLLVQNCENLPIYAQQFGLTTPQAVRDAIDNPSRYRINNNIAAELADAWKKMEDEAFFSIQQQLYGELIAGLFSPNNADALAYVQDNGSTTVVDYVTVPYSVVSDDEAKLSDADYNAAYEKVKGRYKILDETREVAYIVVPIVPSADDRAATAAKVNAMKTRLATLPGSEAVVDATEADTRTFKVPQNQVGQLGLGLIPAEGLAAGMVLEANTHNPDLRTIIKVLDVTEGADEVTVSLMPAQNYAQLDSIFPDKSAAAVDSIITVTTQGQYSHMRASLVNGTLADGTQLPASLIEALATTPVGTYGQIADTIQGQPMAFGYVVNTRSDVAPVYEILAVNYETVPSSKTTSDLSQKLHAFVANNGTAKAFTDNAAKSGYANLGYNLLDQNSYSVSRDGSTPESISYVKWAMKADKDAVSPVFSVNHNNDNYLLAVAVVDIFDDEFVPATSNFVKNDLKPAALRDKKASILVNRYKGKAKDIEGYAQAMGSSVLTSNMVGISNNPMGGEAAGKVAKAKKGELVGPVKGANGVYVALVKEQTPADTKNVDLKVRSAELQNGNAPTIYSPLNYMNIEIFRGDRKLKNNLLFFTSDPENTK